MPFQCKTCKKNFDSESILERHGWSEHPSDEYQKTWSQTNWSTYRGSSYYQDDPYY